MQPARIPSATEVPPHRHCAKASPTADRCLYNVQRVLETTTSNQPRLLYRQVKNMPAGTITSDKRDSSIVTNVEDVGNPFFILVYFVHDQKENPGRRTRSIAANDCEARGRSSPNRPCQQLRRPATPGQTHQCTQLMRATRGQQGHAGEMARQSP